MKKKNVLLYSLVFANLFPLILIVIWFVFMYIFNYLKFGEYFNVVSNSILSIFTFYVNKLVFLFDSIILFVCFWILIKKANINYIIKFLYILLLFIFNIAIDFFVYITYCLLISV